MPYMVTFTINIPQMLAYIPYMDPMGMCTLNPGRTPPCARGFFANNSVGTKTAAQHDPSFPELALLFLLLGAVFCHHLEDRKSLRQWAKLQATLH